MKGMIITMAEYKNDNPRGHFLGLDDMIQQNISSYEYFNSLPQSIRRRLESKDISSFSDMQKYAAEEIKNNTGI